MRSVMPEAPKDTPMRSQVACVRCESYDTSEVYEAVCRGVELVGSVGAFARSRERILLKPNALWATDPDRAVVTHPSILAAAARLFVEAGANVTYGDSPGGIGKAATTLKRCGFIDAVAGLPVALTDFDHGKAVSYAGGVSSKLLFIANGVCGADAVISLPKLKTHGLVSITCAIKNQYGCVPGIVKGEYHARFPDIFDFSRLLVDITGLVRPRLYIVDAVWAMEGNGPQGGDPKRLNCLLFSSDPVAVDTVACRLVDCATHFVPTIKAGAEAGLGTSERGNIDLVGDPIEDFIDPSFRVRRVRPLALPQNPFLRELRRHFTLRPAINKTACTRCGMCIKVCPVTPKAVGWKSRSQSRSVIAPPVYDYRNCIRCFCCHEMCPSKAISVKRPLLRRLFPMASYLGLAAAHLHNFIARIQTAKSP
jgi:uncharacterized protein (DUF362 family)/Pyruvate/2-oxoacid:ferredoxin oxidoreductase delta subunit